MVSPSKPDERAVLLPLSIATVSLLASSRQSLGIQYNLLRAPSIVICRVLSRGAILSLSLHFFSPKLALWGEYEAEDLWLLGEKQAGCDTYLPQELLSNIQ